MAVGDILLGVHEIDLWVRAADTTLGAAITGTADSTITLTSAAAMADATAIRPVHIMIDNEILHVQGTTTTPVVVRGRDGTTAATHSNGATVKILRPVQVEKAADWTPNADIQDIAVPGDGTVEHIFRFQGLTGVLTANRWPEHVIEVAMGVPDVTVGILSDMTSWKHPQQGGYPLVAMHVNLVALDGDNNNATITKRIIMWQCQLQNPFVPGPAGNNALEGTPINWSAQPGTTDLFGRTIAGVTQNIHYTVGNVAA
jgi:hypothetical protein